MEEGILAMSKKELTRLEIVQRVAGKQLRQTEAARLLSLTGTAGEDAPRLRSASGRTVRGCPEFCVNGVLYCCGIRSSNWIVNRFSAAFQSLMGIVHFLLMLFSAR